MAEVSGEKRACGHDIHCDPCRGDGDVVPAVGYCSQCREYLCKDCLHAHRRVKATRQHQILEGEHLPTDTPERSDNEDTSAFEICPIHSQTKEPIKFYCPTHNEFGCGDCIVLSHRNCKVDYIPDVAKGFKDSEEFTSLTTSIRDIEMQLQTIDERNQTVHDCNVTTIERAVEDIRKFKAEIMSYLNSKEEKLVNELEVRKTKNKTALDKTNTRSGEFKQTLGDIKKDVESTQQGDMNKLFMRAKQGKDKLQNLVKDIEILKKNSSMQREYWEFKREKSLESLLANQINIGQVNNAVLDMSSCKVFHDHDVNVDTTGDIESCDITGIELLDNGLLVLVDHLNEAIKVFNMTTKKVEARFRLPEQPWDLTVLEDTREMAVTSYESSTIWILAYRDNSLKEVHRFSVTGQPHGIDSKGGLLAVVYGDQRKIEIMDRNAVVKNVIRNDQIDGYNRYIAFTNDGAGLYVTCKNNSVSKLLLDGQCLTTYSDSDLMDPFGLTVTRDGTLLVCGFDSHNIHVVTADGRKVRILLSEKDGLRWPQSTYLCEENGVMYVGCAEDNVLKVFKIK